MHARTLSLLALAGLAACFSPDRAGFELTASDDAGTTAPDGDGSAGSGPDDATGPGGGDPADCHDDEACADDNPCSHDRCEAGTCTHAPIVDDPSCVCTGVGDCTTLPPDDDCQARACEDGICTQRFADHGTPIGAAGQTAADCQQVVCDGQGGTTTIADDTDVPASGLECTEDACVDGVPTSIPVREGTECSAGECNDAGACTGCSDASECAGTPSFCLAITCDAHVCGVMATDDGVTLPDGDQTTGDCLRRACDGRGNVAQVAQDSDLPPDDGLECTDETCNDGLVGHPAREADTPCSTGVCDGDGNCRECNHDDQCPAAGACTVGVCNDGVCGVGFADSGTSCNDGLFCTASDGCDGGGNCVGAGNPCPGADGDGDCSEQCNEAADACTGNDAPGSACSDGLFCTSGDTCNGAGACIGGANPCPGADGDSDCSESCNEAADACTGNDPGGTDCGACRTCSNGTCGASDCGVGEKCCAADDLCIPTNASCP